MKHLYTIEMHEHGALICAAPGQAGVPIEAMSEAAKFFGKRAVIGMGIGHHYNVVRGLPKVCIVIADSPHALQAWLKAIEEAVAAAEQNLEMRWWKGIDTGASSMAIFFALKTLPGLEWHEDARCTDTPMDCADFGRCQRLVELIPGWRERLPEVAAKYPETKWPAIIARWDEIVAATPERQSEILRTI